MKKTNPIPLLCIFFFSVFITAKPADAKVNEELLSKYKSIFYDKYKYAVLYDKEGFAYLQCNGSQYITLVSYPDAKKGETTLVIPDTVEIKGKKYTIAEVGDYSVYEISDYLGKGIGGALFTLGTGYKKIIFGKNVSYINYGAFSCDETLEEIQFLGKNIALDDDSFCDCKKLKQITGSENISRIYWGALANTAIHSFKMTDVCKIIDENAFSGCTKLKEIPDISKVEDIRSCAFSGCTSLKKVVIPEGVRTLPEAMFSGCRNITEVYLPKSLEYIGENVFSGCTKLKGNVTIHSKNKYLTAKDNMILNKKGDTLLSMISPVKVMVIPSYVKKVEEGWEYDDYGKKFGHYLLDTIIVQNKNIKFSKLSVPCWYTNSDKQKIKILYPDTRKAFKFKEDHVRSFPGKFKPSKYYTQRPYKLHPAPTRLKAKLKKGKVQVSFKKLKNAAVKKYKITYRIKKNGTYKAQKKKVIKGRRATLCSLKKGEICEVRVSAYTKQSGVWLPGKFSRMVKVRGK